MFQKKLPRILRHILCSGCFFEIHVMCEIMLKNLVQPDRPQMTIWHMRIACWIPKATNTLTICTTHFFSIRTMVVRTPLNITLLVHCLSFYLFLSSICCIFFLYPPFFLHLFFFPQCFYAILALGEKKKY